jgi:hypothetical protein
MSCQTYRTNNPIRGHRILVVTFGRFKGGSMTINRPDIDLCSTYVNGLLLAYSGGKLVYTLQPYHFR